MKNQNTIKLSIPHQLTNRQYHAPARRTFTAAMALALCVGANDMMQAQLTGSGLHLPGPISLTPGVSTSFPTIVASTANARVRTWPGSGGEPAGYLGTYTETGPNPSELNIATGLTIYNFTTLPFGVLPAGAHFNIADLDDPSGGSGGAEVFTLQAFGPSGALITDPWLETPALTIYGTGSAGGLPLFTDTPGWNWNGSTYTFDGSTVPDNPSVGVRLASGVDIESLQFNRNNESNTFNIGAPIVPEPATGMLLGLALPMLLGFRRPASRRSSNI